MKKYSSALYAVAFGLIGVSAAVPAVAGSYDDWSGFYVGLNAGGTSSDADFRTSTVYSGSGYFASSSVPAIAATGAQGGDESGFTGGVTGGYNWQVDNFVFGVETDFNAVDADVSRSATATYPCCAPTTITVSSAVSTDWAYTLRARAGVLASPALLLYATGGLAAADVKADFLFTDTFATAHESASKSKTKTGWTAGVGGEYAWSDSWSVKAEYLYADLGEVSATSTNLTAFSPAIAYPVNVFTHSVDLHTNTVRVGVNYKF